MSEVMTLQKLINAFVDSAHELQRVSEEYDRKEFKGIKLKADLGLSDADIESRLLPKIRPKVQAHRTALQALIIELKKIDATIP